MNTINLEEKFNLIEEYWSPYIIAELNGQHVKLAKIQGEFIWHSHEQEDEMFYVLEGALEMHFRNEVKYLGPGDMIVVPKGVEHKPVAPTPTSIMLFEPDSTVNTGDQHSHLTKKEIPKI